MSCSGAVVVFLGLMVLHSAESLMCYQCAATQKNSPCVDDYEGLQNTTKGISDTYKKNCTDSNSRWDRCVIEMHLSSGKYTYFKRGCHDGKYFNKNVNDKEFLNLTANNYTTCAVPKLEVVCFSFCQSDYCNGPRREVDECDSDNQTSLCGAGVVHDNRSTTLLFVYNLVVITVVWGVCNKVNLW